MARRREKRNKELRIDLFDLDIHSVLLEDLRHYVGSPKTYVPKIWDVCMRVLREENRIILNEQYDKDALDAVWNDFFDGFSETRFKRIISEKGLSVRMDGYRDNVTDFYFSIFEIMYPQVAAWVDKVTRGKKGSSFLNYRAEVVEVFYLDVYDGFDTISLEQGVIVKTKAENYITEYLLREEGYDL